MFIEDSVEVLFHFHGIELSYELYKALQTT
jgi:hypothetical protein